VGRRPCNRMGVRRDRPRPGVGAPEGVEGGEQRLGPGPGLKLEAALGPGRGRRPVGGGGLMATNLDEGGGRK